MLAFGSNSPKMLKGALTGGMSNTNARAFESREKLTDVLTSIVRPGDVILVKGSRGMRMELILEQFLKNIHATEDKE